MIKKIKKKFNDNGTQKTAHYYVRDTEHECIAMGGKLTTFSMIRFNTTCPLCKEKVMEIE